MSRMSWISGLGWLLSIGLIAGCSGPSVNPSGAPAPPPLAKTKQVYPDPPPEIVDEVTALVQAWVSERTDEDGLFDIPPRGGHDVAGSFAEVRAVRQQDADTYTVSAEFSSGEEIFDVEFFVDRTAAGLAVRNGYLHKINGEVVSG